MRTLRLLCWLVLLVMATPVMAQSEPASGSAPDVRMVVDVSGSMKQNDPQNLRANALGFAAALLPPSATSSVWTFGTTVDNPLRTGAVDASWRELADRLAPRLTDYQQFTDIERALRQAADDDVDATSPLGGGRDRHLILLTDGMVDLPATGEAKARQDAASRQRILQELAPRLAREGVVVHTIGLSDNVDRALLEQTAQQTDGLAAVARTPEALLRAFLDVLDRILPGDRVPIDARQRFAIDDDIDQFNALLFHTPAQSPPELVGPDGQRYSRDSHPGNVEWLSNDRYELIRVPEPTAGEWRIDGEIGDDSRIGIQAGIRLRSNALPATLYQNIATPLEVWLEDEGEALGAGALPQGMVVRAELRDLDGQVLSQVTLAPESGSTAEKAAPTGETGRFRGDLTGTAALGNARLAVIAESDRLTRERVQAVNVVAALEARLSDDSRHIVVSANHPGLDTRNTELSARLPGQALGIRQTGDREWTIDVPETDPGASLPIRITAEAQLEGRRLHFELPVVRLNPDAAVGLDGAGAIRAVQSDARVEDDTLGTSGELAFGDGMTPAQMIEYAQARARQGWSLAKPYVDDYVIPYAQRPVTWLVIGVMLMLVVLWRSLATARRRRRSARRAEPSLSGLSNRE
ncbi:VWA domain-containing protein [Salinicola aestuarinus]|uniref:VWA domain-containing protein n=1 Tax=Salinicola aestuarinus TaxID=1949082 RepID=UPI000DA23A35|nr:vWA domain-containing protein [Salinicola aestuarinus]